MRSYSYQDVPGASTLCLKVKMGERTIGGIYSAPGGFYYRPAARPCGETYPTLDEVKATLESP